MLISFSFQKRQYFWPFFDISTYVFLTEQFNFLPVMAGTRFFWYDEAALLDPSFFHPFWHSTEAGQYQCSTS